MYENKSIRMKGNKSKNDKNRVGRINWMIESALLDYGVFGVQKQSSSRFFYRQLARVGGVTRISWIIMELNCLIGAFWFLSQLHFDAYIESLVVENKNWSFIGSNAKKMYLAKTLMCGVVAVGFWANRTKCSFEENTIWHTLLIIIFDFFSFLDTLRQIKYDFYWHNIRSYFMFADYYSSSDTLTVVSSIFSISNDLYCIVYNIANEKYNPKPFTIHNSWTIKDKVGCNDENKWRTNLN